MISNSGTSTLGLYDFKRQIDAFGGVDYFRPTLAGGYLPNARVMLANGEIVQNATNDNLTNDPNTDMTGWLKGNSASQILDANGKTQQEINDEQKAKTLFLEDFGATEGGDNTQAFIDVFLAAKANGGGYITSNIRRHIVTDRVIYFDNTEVDLRGGTVESTSNFCNAIYNANRTAYIGHFGGEDYYRYQQALDVGNPFSKFQSSATEGDFSITVLSSAGFAVGDHIMINNGYCDMWRVMESGFNNIPIWNRDDVPLWKCEFAKIKSIVGNVITLESSLKHNYPLIPAVTGIFADENALPAYANWNTPNITRLGGASNVIFRNVNFVKTVASEQKLLNACLATDIQYIDCSFKGFGYGAELTSCVNSKTERCESSTENFGLQIRRSYKTHFRDVSSFFAGNVDSPIIMWEGSHDCTATNVNVDVADGVTGAAIGFYFNTVWDCHAYDVTANNAESVVELSFSHDCTVDGVYGDNSTYLVANYGSRNTTASKMNLRSLKNKSSTTVDNGLFLTRYSNNIKYKDAVAAGIGRYIPIQSFGVFLSDIQAAGFVIFSEDQRVVSYKTSLPYLSVSKCHFDLFTFTTPSATTHNDRIVCISNSTFEGYVYFANKANSELYNVIMKGAGVDSGLLLKSSYYTKVFGGSIGGSTYSIDFTVFGGVDVFSSAIYLYNVALKAPSKFKDYTQLSTYLTTMNTLCKDIQYISKLDNHPQIALFANSAGDGSSQWQVVS